MASVFGRCRVVLSDVSGMQALVGQTALVTFDTDRPQDGVTLIRGETGEGEAFKIQNISTFKKIEGNSLRVQHDGGFTLLDLIEGTMEALMLVFVSAMFCNFSEDLQWTTTTIGVFAEDVRGAGRV